MKKLFIFIGLMFASACMNVQAYAHSVFIDGLYENISNEIVQLNRTLPITHIGIESGAITNEKIREANDIFYMAMGVIGIKNLGKGVVHFAQSLPNNVRTLLRKNKSIRNLIAARYRDWKTAVYKIDEFTTEDILKIEKQEDVWRMFEAVDDITVNSINNFWAKIPSEYLEQVKDTFVDCSISLKFAEKDMILYRHISQNQSEISYWFSRTMESPENARKLLALPDKNTAEWVVKVKIKEGTPYIEGKMASQVNNPSGLFDINAIGGGNQLYFLQENLSDIEVVEKIINPLK